MKCCLAIAALACAAVGLLAGAESGFAQASTPPAPRSIADLTAILDRQKPDTAVIDQRRRVAEAEPGAELAGQALLQFYVQRMQARAALGRTADAIADAERASALAPPASRPRFILDQFLVIQNLTRGEPRRSVTLLEERAPQLAFAPPNIRVALLGHRVHALLGQGDLAAADRAFALQEAAIAEERAKAPPDLLPLYEDVWSGNLEMARAALLTARGRYAEASSALDLSESRFRAAEDNRSKWPPGTAPISNLHQVADTNVAKNSQIKAELGRLSEAEADARRALVSQLGRNGKFHPLTASFCLQLAHALRDQGRYAESESLVRSSLDILRTVGFADSSDQVMAAMGSLANLLRLQGRRVDAAEIYAALDRLSAGTGSLRSASYRTDIGRLLSLYESGQLEAGLRESTQAVDRQKSLVGTQHLDHATAEGVLAIGLARAGREREAIEVFERAAPVLVAQSGSAGGDADGTGVTRRQRLTATLLENYIATLARQSAGGVADGVAGKTFPLADTIRGRSVASAVAASTARGFAQDSALAELARREQDLRAALGAAFALLSKTLALGPEQRDDSTIAVLREQAQALRGEHEKVRLELGVRFPAYADLIDPKPATAEQVQAALKPNEAFVSFYFGTERSFVWAIGKTGPVAFAAIPATAAQIEARVKKLREALEPNASSVADIPAFDLALAHELYALLLKPLEATWRPAKTLVVATNGALGLLPLGVLPTAPTPASTDAGAAFTAYRSVPWLARTHAVSLVPSAAAFRTLRQLPAGAAGRQALIGFGDPVFNAQQAADALKNAPPHAPATASPPLERRSAPQTAGMASATLASLPALPDTAEELRSVATALKAQGKDVLNLGKAASEENVTSADLAKYRVVAFATHGLVAGELDGLTQPALAMSAPSVTGGKGDGLLTLEKILALKLDADWVVLSACNTGAGDGAGAEAASGLGRAFFYAGTRAILVTNWSVHSQSARDLVTDLFRRQAADPKLSRAEALRASMTGMIDGPGFTDDKGKTVFTYAHPLFWAPYSIIGDGG